MMDLNLSDKEKILVSSRVGWASALFTVVMAVLLIANFIQIKLNDPVNNKTIPALVKRLSQNPSDENLKAEIRAFDLMARKAYFTSQWQIRTGSYLLLLGVIITILAVRANLSYTSRLNEIDRIEHVNGLDELMARKWVIYSGSGILVLALLSGLLTNNMLKDYQLDETSAPVAENTVPLADKPAQEGVKVAADTASPAAAAPGKTIPADSVPAKTIASPAETPQAPVPSAYPTTAELKANYPFFRGPEGIGVAYQKNVPVDWNGPGGKNILWKVKVPKPGFSSPVIWGDRLFVTGADAQARMVYCYDRNSGKLLWEAAADKIQGSPASVPKVTSDTGLAASTMATNGRAVFAIFATGDVIAFDMEGQRLWARNIGVPDNHYGHSSSLVVYKDNLLVQYDTNKAGKLMALSVKTGETAWETPRKSKIAWSSPALVNTGSRMEVILSTNPNISGYNPETGKELWSVDCLTGEVGPSVGYNEGMVFAANEYAKLVGIKLGPTPEIAWEADEFLPEVSSPLAVKGLLYIATSYGVFACYEAKTGTKLWSEEYGDSFYSSPVYADGKVFITDMSGKTHIVQATKEYQLVGTPELGEKAVCSPVFSNGRIYLRGMNQLYCIGSK